MPNFRKLTKRPKKRFLWRLAFKCIIFCLPFFVCVLTSSIHSSILRQDASMKFFIQVYLTLGYMVTRLQNDIITRFKMAAIKWKNIGLSFVLFEHFIEIIKSSTHTAILYYLLNKNMPTAIIKKVKPHYIKSDLKAVKT